MAKVQRQQRREKERSGLLSQLQDVVDDGGLIMSVYGKSGTGKTTLWSTFPKPICAVVCGKRSGELRSTRGVKGIKKFELVDSDQIKPLCEEIKHSEEFKTVVLDHASYLQDMVMREILDLDEIPVQKSWGLASQQQYGQCSLKMKEFLRSFIELPTNVVIVSQEREFNVEQQTDILMPFVGSALSPSVTGWLNPACDYVVQTYKAREKKKVKKKLGGKVIVREEETGRTRYYLRTGPDPVYTTKFRLPRGYPLPDNIVDPNYEKIMEVINGEYDASAGEE